MEVIQQQQQKQEQEQEQEQEEVAVPVPVTVTEESLVKRRSTTPTAATRTTSENGSSTLTTVSSSSESESWTAELDTGSKNITEPGSQPEPINIKEAADDADDDDDDDEMMQEEVEKSSVNFYTNIEGLRGLATSHHQGHEVAGTDHRDQVVEWSGFNLKREELASKFKDVDIELLISSAINNKQIDGKHLEIREGETSQDIRLKEGETVIYEMEESDEEVVELEFDAAVEKMHTHEGVDGYGMYCPNCSSRITKVVLRRKIRQRRILVGSGNERRDLLGCLSCFSVFIPIGNKLNPFRIFGGRRERHENIRLQEELPTSDIGTATSDVAAVVAAPRPVTTEAAEERGFDLFSIFKRRRVDDESAVTSPLLPEAALPTTVTPKPGDEALKKDGEAREENIQLPREQPAPDLTVSKTDSAQVKGKGFDLFWIFRKRIDEETALTTPLIAAAAQVQTSSTGVSTAAGITYTTTVTSKPRDEAFKPGDGVTQQEKDIKIAGIGVHADSTQTFQDNSFIPTVSVGEKTVGKLERVASAAAAVGGKVSQISPPQGTVVDGNVVIDVYEKQEELVRRVKPPVQPQLQIKGDKLPQGGDVRIPVVETPAETGIPESAAAGAAIVATRTEIVTESSRTSLSLDILKSIVYGGLMESITSLVVVSLAIASNATTMNVVAIGLAYLVGGLILLIHYLRVLRYGHSTQTSEERYQEQLGRKELFPLHATVAVVSHIAFGLIPPVVYGFTFRGTGDKDFKMLAVGAASLICIVVLAIALAYVRGENRFVAYFKTVVYYVFVAAIASAAAFGIAYLIKDPFPCPTVLSEL